MENLELQKFKEILTKTKSGLLSNNSDIKKLHVEKTADEVDAANAQLNQTLETKLLSRKTSYLRKIDYALEKIGAATYGECEKCGDDIGVKRLLARPTASLCLYCKEAQEKRETALQKTSGINDWEPE